MKPVRHFVSLYCLLFIAGLICTANAQTDPTNARAASLAGAYSAVANGAEAIHWNPAFLGFRSSTRFSLLFPAMGFGVQNNSFSVDDYRQYNGATLTDMDKATILTKIPESGLGVFMNGGSNLLALSISRFALSASIVGTSDLRISKTFVDLLLNGNVFGKEYDFSGTTGAGYALAVYSLSYGQPLPLRAFDDFAVGFSVKMLQGLISAEVVSARGTLTTDFDGFHGDGRAEVRTAAGGNGYAVDFGAAGRLASSWRLSWTLRNAFNRVTWNREVTTYIYGVSADSLNAELFSNTDADSLIDDYDAKIEGGQYQTNLPVVMAFGIAYSTRAMLYSLEYTQGFKDAPGSSRSPRLAFGAEYKGFHFLPLRAGIAFGGKEQFLTAFGVGLRFGTFSINLATQAFGGMFLPGNGRGSGFALDMKVGI